MAEKTQTKPRSRWQEGLQKTDDFLQLMQLGTFPGLLTAAGGLGVKWLNSPSKEEAAKFAPKAQPAQAPQDLLSFDIPGAAAIPGRAGNTGFDDFARAIISQESGGRYGLTSSAGAMGVGQVMPATGAELAKRNGLPWRPELMTGSSVQAQDYQNQIARLALEDAWKAGQGNPAKAAQYYHAGPNPAQAGPKTASYVNSILDKLGLAAPQGGGNPFEAPPQAYVDPAQAQSMIPNPRMVPRVDLPDAPQLEALPAPQPYQTADVPALLQELKAAMQPQEPDQENRKKDLKFGDINGAIQGATLGLAGGLPGVLIGALLGGVSTHAFGRQNQLREDRARSAQSQKAEQILAQLGLDMNLKNLGIDNQNLDRAFAGTKSGVDTRNLNAVNQNSRLVDEIMANAGIDKANVGAVNDTARTRASVGLSALEGVAGAQNQANRQQGALDMAAYTSGASLGGNDSKQLQRRANNLLSSVGIAPERLDGARPDANLDNARNTAYAIEAGNVEGAVNGLAQEIVTTGLAKDILGDNDAKAVEKAIREKNPQAAVAIVAGALNADKAATAKLSDQLATRGLVTAKMISARRKRDQAQGQQQPATAAR